MTLEKVQERLKLLETDRDNLRASLIAHDGAIMDCKFWLEQLNIPSENASNE